MSHGRHTPGCNRYGVTDLHAETINEPTESKQTNPIGPLEGGINQTKFRICPLKLLIQDRLEQRKNLTIDIVDRGGKKKKSAYGPAISNHPRDSIHGFISFFLQYFSMAGFNNVAIC